MQFLKGKGSIQNIKYNKHNNKYIWIKSIKVWRLKDYICIVLIYWWQIVHLPHMHNIQLYNTSYTYNLYRIHALCLNTNDLSVYSLYSYNIYFRKSKSFIICCLVYLYCYIQKLFRLGKLFWIVLEYNRGSISLHTHNSVLYEHTKVLRVQL